MCKQQPDMEGQESISDGEWARMISTVYGELYGAVADSGMRYFETATTLVADGTNVLSEPSDHLATVGLDYLVTGSSTGERRALVEIMAQERNRLSGLSGEARAFSLVDDRILLFPTPPTGHVFELVYIPQPPKLTSFGSGDAVDVVGPDGESFLVWGVTVLAKGKEESDVSLAKQERDAAKARLVEWAAMRAFNEPRRPASMSQYGWAMDAADWWERVVSRRLQAPVVIRLADKDAERVRQSHAECIGELQTIPVIRGTLRRDIELPDGVNVPVPHSLGRAGVTAWLSVVQSDEAATVGSVIQISDATVDGTKYVVLRASGWGQTVHVDAWIF